MALANCKSCGRLFNMTHNDVCPICVREEEEAFYTIRDYLKEHRRASIYEVSDATGIEPTLIIKFIREGRISTVDNPGMHYPCDSCGTAIGEGRYCKPCKDRLKSGLAQSKDELVNSMERQKSRDYYYRRDR